VEGISRLSGVGLIALREGGMTMVRFGMTMVRFACDRVSLWATSLGRVAMDAFSPSSSSAGPSRTSSAAPRRPTTSSRCAACSAGLSIAAGCSSRAISTLPHRHVARGAAACFNASLMHAAARHGTWAVGYMDAVGPALALLLGLPVWPWSAVSTRLVTRASSCM